MQTNTHATPTAATQTPAAPTTPISETKADTLVEPRTGTPHAALPTSEDMFLSPRVMDAGTFARYSEMLKSIITQATTQGRTLEDFSADAEEMIRRASESTTTLDKRLQAGVRMMRMIDERVDRTDAALDKVREMLPNADSMNHQIESLMNFALDNAQTQIDAMVRDADIRAQAAEQRARVAMEKTEEQTKKLQALNADLDMRMSAIEQRINEAEDQTGQSIGLIDRRLVSFQDELNDQIEQVVERATTTTNEIEERVLNASRLTEERVNVLGQSITPLQNAAEQAMRALGMDPENPRFEDSPLSKIESLVERGEAHIAGVDRVLRQLNDLRSQAEGVKGEFGMWLIDSAEKLDELESRRDLLEGPINDAAMRISEIGPDLEDKLELASNKLEHLSTQSGDLKDSINTSSVLAERATDKLTNQASQLQALLDGSLHRLTQRVEQAGVWLGSLITRAEQIGREIETNTPTNQQTNQQTHQQIEHQSSRSDEAIITESKAIETPTLDDQQDDLNKPITAAEILRTVDQVQSKLEQLNEPAPAPELTMTERSAQSWAHLQNPTQVPAETEIKDSNIKDSKELPDRLPIDSISFDGTSSMVFEYDDGTQAAD
ncbi:MAG: hypothetical protein JJ974_00920 [Phycisphaerales bacterium]|nr:hypothetical protein [Phycisphaerales bacterium]